MEYIAIYYLYNFFTTIMYITCVFASFNNFSHTHMINIYTIFIEKYWHEN